MLRKIMVITKLDCQRRKHGALLKNGYSYIRNVAKENHKFSKRYPEGEKSPVD